MQASLAEYVRTLLAPPTLAVLRPARACIGTLLLTYLDICLIIER